MLRITLVSQTAEETVLKVEGQVAGADVILLEQEGMQYCEEGKRLMLDFAGVQFIDEAGIGLLRRWSGQGLVLRNGSDFIQTLLRTHGLENS